MRTVTFQSMARMSLPAAYSRTSANSMPSPLNTEWYSPPNMSVTSRRVRISMCRTLRRTSRGIMGGSGHLDGIEQFLGDRGRGHVFRFRLERGNDAVAKHVESDRLHIVRGDVAPSTKESVGLRRLRQVNRGAR